MGLIERGSKECWVKENSATFWRCWMLLDGQPRVEPSLEMCHFWNRRWWGLTNSTQWRQEGFEVMGKEGGKIQQRERRQQAFPAVGQRQKGLGWWRGSSIWEGCWEMSNKDFGSCCGQVQWKLPPVKPYEPFSEMLCKVNIFSAILLL